MNQLVIIDTDALTPATVFAPGGVEGIISKLETDVRAIDRDISTPDGREDVKKLAYKIARSKTLLDDMGKELVAGIKAQAATIDAERRIIRDRLDALKEEVRGPLTAWETAEADRVDTHERALVTIAQGHLFDFPPTSTQIMERQVELSRVADRDWQEFRERADEAYQAAFPRLEEMRAAAEQAERDAAELAELRKLKAEREEADRKAAEAAAAAEQARLIEEARAAREAKEAARSAEIERQHAELAVQRERQRTEQAERDKAAAVAKAIEDEQRRAAAAKAAEEAAERKRQENKRHRAKVLSEIRADLVGWFPVTVEAADVLVEKLAAGAIRHVSITY